MATLLVWPPQFRQSPLDVFDTQEEKKFCLYNNVYVLLGGKRLIVLILHS